MEKCERCAQLEAEIERIKEVDFPRKLAAFSEGMKTRYAEMETEFRAIQRELGTRVVQLDSAHATLREVLIRAEGQPTAQSERGLRDQNQN